MTEYGYFPGCSVKGAGSPYERSLLTTFRALGITLTELRDWNCCGATAYLSVDVDMAAFLAARNLALAEAEGGADLVAPCSGCFLALTKVKETLAEYPDVRQKVSRALGAINLTYRGRVRIRHPLEVLMTDVGPDAIRKRVTHPLKNIRLVPYYGCAILRPYETVDRAHAPTILENFLRLTGATVVDFPYKSRCCGGMLTSGVPPVGLRLVEILLEEAKRLEADAVVTTCPLCQYNLECFQDRLSKSLAKDLRVPVIYFTQALGLAFGLGDEALGMDQLLRTPRVAAEVR